MNSRLFGMITTASSSRYTSHALETLLKTTPLSPSDRLILVDNNNCFEGAPLTIQARVDIIRNDIPKGFAANMNMILREARKEHASAILLNNDLIFTSGWLNDEDGSLEAIASPLSSRELEYTLGDFQCRNPMQLDDFLGHEKELASIAAAHRKKNRGSMNVLVLPFFAPSIPAPIIQTVGMLDESFGKGGGEDYDYCLRAILAGYRVHYDLGSYLLHFGGKSSWSGAETDEEQRVRERIFFSRFEEKWGSALTDIILRNSFAVLEGSPDIDDMIKQERFTDLIRYLLKKSRRKIPEILIE